MQNVVPSSGLARRSWNLLYGAGFVLLVVHSVHSASIGHPNPMLWVWLALTLFFLFLNTGPTNTAPEPQNLMAVELMVMQKLISVPANRTRISALPASQVPSVVATAPSS